jgi:N-acyl homoserine lactone hydrolase
VRFASGLSAALLSLALSLVVARAEDEVVLSGDAVHFKSNWDNRRVPAINYNKEQTLASMEKLAETVREEAQLWINHDKDQRDILRMAPEFYD